MVNGQKEAYEVVYEGSEAILRINANSWSYSPSIEDSALVMGYIIDRLVEMPGVSRIMFNQRRNFTYEYDQTQMLLQVSQVYNHLVKTKKVLSILTGFQEEYGAFFGEKLGILQYLVYNLLRTDPVGCYVEVKRLLREEKINFEKETNPNIAEARKKFLEVLLYVYSLLDNTRMISLVRDKLDGHSVGDRGVYKNLFRAVITPDFIFTRLMAEQPLNGEQVDLYKVKDGAVTIFKIPGQIRLLYHLNPEEFNLNEDEYSLIELARNVLGEHKPREEEFLEPSRLRNTFYNIGKDLLNELIQTKGYDISYERLDELAKILVRYTVGFGLIEILMQDEKVQDIVVNSPIGSTPMFIVHQDFGECVTNIVPSRDDAESWATKFRLYSGRPLDEANPVLDTELLANGSRGRVSVMGSPLSPTGLAYAIRRHRDKPWTLPLFINNKMISPLGAGLISFLVDGARSLIFSGTRSSGKCVDGNTSIQLSNGSILLIKKLIGDCKAIISDGEIYHSKLNYQVPCLKNFKVIHSAITDVWKRKSPEKLVKLITRSGKSIITTCEHPYFVYVGGLKAIRADNLKKGELIATPRQIEIKGKKIYLDLKDESFILDELPDKYVIKGKTNSKPFVLLKEITPEFAEFIGLIIGDGHLDQTKLEFHNSCFEMRKKYKAFLDKLQIIYREFKSHTTIVVQVCSRTFSRILNKYFEIPFGRKSDKIVIPQLILQSTNEALSAFLRGYFDTDGYIPKNKRDMELVTASRTMAEHLKLALLRFGIICFTKIKKVNGVDYYRTLIRGSFVNRFSECINFSHPFKKRRMEYIVATKILDNTNVDTIPDGNKLIAVLRNKLRMSPRDFSFSGKDYWAYETNQYRVTRKWFKILITFFRNHYKDLKSLQEEISFIRDLGKFDYKVFINNIEQLRILLGLSYVTLAFDSKYSDTGVRRTLKGYASSDLEKIQAFISSYRTFEKRLMQLGGLIKDSKIPLENVINVVRSGITSFAQISRDTGIKETTLKSYLTGDVKPNHEKLLLLEQEWTNIKRDLMSRLEQARCIIQNLAYLPMISNRLIQLGIILERLRTTLNIENEEFVPYGICQQTVSNFFNGKYSLDHYNINTVQSIIKCVLEKYDSCLDKETEQLLSEADILANSDIFWDEVLSVEIIDKVDDFVYDLTVEGTHNFIANGLIAHNTSLLSAMMIEIMRKYRVITLEDTLEIPIDSLRNLGYNIQNMKVRSALMTGGVELGADEGIRTSLRFGDSSLIIGEIRSLEAKALYEAMRIGALANVVAGTIHGADPYSVFDRVVNDLGVPKTSFKATDVIVISNPVTSADGLRKFRRVLQISEVRKHWQEDPLKEAGFMDLMRYDVKKDILEPTSDLKNGESDVIKAVAANVKEWVGNWDAVWDNIMLRAKIKEALVEYANKANMLDLLEADFVVRSNDMFHILSEKIREESGSLDSKRIYFDWREWLKREIKLRKV